MADSNLVARLRAVTANSLICREAADALAEQAETIERLRHEFKNFHRLLCERFGYGHDEIDWQRDQLSLIEWIAKRGVHQAQNGNFWTVEECRDSHWTRSAVGHAWALETDARIQCEELRRTYGNRIFRVREYGAAPCNDPASPVSR